MAILNHFFRYIIEFNGGDSYSIIDEERFTYLGTYNEQVVFYLDHDKIYLGPAINTGYKLPVDFGQYTPHEGVYVFSK